MTAPDYYPELSELANARLRYEAARRELRAAQPPLRSRAPGWAVRLYDTGCRALGTLIGGVFGFFAVLWTIGALIMVLALAWAFLAGGPATPLPGSMPGPGTTIGATR